MKIIVPLYSLSYSLDKLYLINLYLGKFLSHFAYLISELSFYVPIMLNILSQLRIVSKRYTKTIQDNIFFFFCYFYLPL